MKKEESLKTRKILITYWSTNYTCNHNPINFELKAFKGPNAKFKLFNFERGYV